VLVEQAGQIVVHKELISRVWRNLVVDSGSLRTQITSLRKALGDGEGTARYIETVPGRGYCFVAPVSRQDHAPRADPVASSSSRASLPTLALPPVPGRMVGRDELTRTIAGDLIAHRFVTIVGPGGMGKTTVAVAVAHAMLKEFPAAVCFVNLGSLSDPAQVASTVASTLGLTIRSEDALPSLKASLQGTRMLLVLDNCEHLIAACAELAEQIFREAPAVHILATSREALRVDGEYTCLLPALECPPPGAEVTAAQAQSFSAVKLFMECVAASGSHFELSDETAPIAAGICTRLDGNPLAIEFAAGRVGAYGIEGLASLLESRFGLDWRGRRTALLRHQTLHATIDWSHDLLSESEQLVLRRLSVFVGPFTLEAAQAVASGQGPGGDEVVIGVGGLVAKSLLSTVTAHDRAIRYRLLETTRAYAAEKLQQSGEMSATAQRHARYFSLLLNSTASGGIDPHHDHHARALSEHLGNVRAALDWCFGDREAGTFTTSAVRDASLGVDLTAAAAPGLLQLLLLTECHQWSTKALSLLGDTVRGSAKEMVLQETLAIASMWTRENGDDVRAAIARGLDIANRLGETKHRLRLMVGLHIYLTRAGEFKNSLAIAQELRSAARTMGNETYTIMADWLRGSSLHFIGDQRAAQRYYQDSLERAGPRNLPLFGLDSRVRALATHARVLWLIGLPVRAMAVANEAIAEAAAAGRSVDVCFSLLYTSAIFLWCGDWDAAERALEKLMQQANWHALQSFHATGLAFKGELLVHRGHAEQGTALLRTAVKAMKAERNILHMARAACALAQGLIQCGQLDEALAVTADAIAPDQAGPEALDLPELLRIQAEALLLISDAHQSRAEDCLVRSLDCARPQHTLAWELRTATSLARLRARQGRRQEALQSLQGVYRRFTEGFETRDLKVADALLKELHTSIN
jgi:predicted ATPase/DNA-binding winged helix-turn-helix (wHTH) protein